MANSLLDFVMSLVRDPDAAARYAADPDGSIASANLTGVTTTDVNSLIPVVADSMSTPFQVGTGHPAVDGPRADGNVWTSGAASQAFEAFDVFDAPAITPAITPGVSRQSAESAAVSVADVDSHPGSDPLDSPAQAADQMPYQQPEPTIFDEPEPGWGDPAGWDHDHIGPEHTHDHDAHPGMDM